jgi:hypothetical protein
LAALIVAMCGLVLSGCTSVVFGAPVRASGAV